MTETAAAPYNLATHNGCITVVNPATGNHRTFRIKTQKKDAGFKPGERLVGIMDGPDNIRNYTNFGTVNEDGSIYVWYNHRSPATMQNAAIISDPVRYMASHNLEYMFEGRCRICNRKLTNPESIASGLGPECGGRR